MPCRTIGELFKAFRRLPKVPDYRVIISAPLREYEIHDVTVNNADKTVRIHVTARSVPALWWEKQNGPTG